MKDVLLLRPWLGVPFKKSLYTENDESNLPQIRLYWKDFLDKLIGYLHQESNLKVVHGPLWSFSPQLVEKYNPDIVFVPHKTSAQFPVKCEARYYMQMVFPHLFSVDPKGWSGSAADYPLDIWKGDPDSDVFEQYQKRIAANVSKFGQPNQQSDGFDLPGTFIFFPFQIPHDESIRLHSDYSIEKVFESLCQWAEKSGVPVIAKGHPVNPDSMRPLNDIARRYNVRVLNNVSVHDLLQKCSWVYTVNSGVGFEALLHEKPVVVFGECEYDSAVYVQKSLGPEAFTESLENVRFDPFATRRIFDVFVNHFCVDSRDVATYDRVSL